MSTVGRDVERQESSDMLVGTQNSQLLWKSSAVSFFFFFKIDKIESEADSMQGARCGT